jgi:hypothetical protein
MRRGRCRSPNVLAVSQAAKNVVLLGDPQQLEQPVKGSHPDGAEVSALEHLLAGQKTIAPDMGLFLEKTWRLQEALRLHYGGVLRGTIRPARGTRATEDWKGIRGWVNRASGSFLSITKAIRTLRRKRSSVSPVLFPVLCKPVLSWTDEKGRSRPLQLNDVLIVAPYNAQVSDLSKRIPHALVGTVDKFQGQQAPVVIYSLTTSSPEDAPRGMEFLYSLNRLNVATSRAQAVVIVVGSPRLLEPECRSPWQMQLANALCRYAEMAQAVEPALWTRQGSR